MTSKIVTLTDALGNPVGFELLPGQRHDTLGVAALIEDRSFGRLIADRAFDVNWIVEEMEHRGARDRHRPEHQPHRALPDRPRRLPMAPPDRELFR